MEQREQCIDVQSECESKGKRETIQTAFFSSFKRFLLSLVFVRRVVVFNGVERERESNELNYNKVESKRIRIET